MINHLKCLLKGKEKLLACVIEYLVVEGASVMQRCLNNAFKSMLSSVLASLRQALSSQ